ncbi:MAG: hypothetical protein UHM23_06875 [Clostridia bacterium]|nr:hypothetical protein [Clostridia bacterium]
MKDEKRMIDEFEVVNSIHIGDSELVLCENMRATDGQYYMTCYVSSNELFELYNDAVVSDSYVDIARIYADRLTTQIEKVKAILDAEKAPLQVITAKMCEQDIFGEDMTGKILVVKPENLRAEYRTASHQIIRCTGGNGASPKGLGSKVYNTRMFDGNNSYFERADILGELKPEYYPEWLNEVLEREKRLKEFPDAFEYEGKHFIGVGYVSDKDNALNKVYSDTELNLTAYNNGTYNYNAFYRAANNSPYDIFKCLENNKNYIPGENELFGYLGEVANEKEQPKKQTKKKNKEMER